ncbi:MAG: tRNA epoxyqueuosine(34) reductase QueG [Mangrovibacterium sp.]
MPRCTEDKIKAKAHELGFLSCGIARADHLSDFEERLHDYINTNRYADLHYMAQNQEKRCDPRLLVEGCQSVVSVTLNYFNPQLSTHTDAPILSKYAYGKDYHVVMKDKLHELMHFINEEIAPCSGRAFVDSAPVGDKQWAQRAGLGWIGKNSLLITPSHGSFVFIGELLLDLQLTPDAPYTANHCGTCTKCIDACPTQALLAPGKLDVARCISYHTTANKSKEIDARFQGKFQNRVFGCDICQDVCPWNSKAMTHEEPEFTPKPELLNLSTTDWQSLTEEQFRELFRHSPIKRAKYQGLMRNISFIH